MKAKGLILILIVVSMLLSSLFARAENAEEILKARFHSTSSQSFATACGDFPVASELGYNSFSRMALIFSGKIEVVTNVYKQKGCRELARVEYMKGSIVIQNEEAKVLITKKYLVLDQALSAETMEYIDARLPRPTEDAMLPSHFGEILQGFTKPNRINYVIDVINPEEQIYQLQMDSSGVVLHIINENFGTSVLTKK